MEGKQLVMLPEERAPSMIVKMGSSGAGSLVPLGARSFGNYELLARLATGGMAEIFLARAREPLPSGSVLVIKRVLPHLAEDARFVAMFRDEARLAARIEHPNVCRVIDLGSVGDTYFIALEYLHGLPLSRVLVRAARQAQPLDFRLVAGLMVQGCAGLHDAHELRGADGERLDVVHRDISPPNIFVTVDGVVKLLDFGVAKAHGASEKTRTGTVKGKNAYMSPEQVRGQPMDRRSDIFSLGIVLWEALTAQRLFMREVDFETFRAITQGEVPDVRSVRPETPGELADVVARALALDPADRYATALELGDAVAAAVVGIGSPAGEREISSFLRTRFAKELRAREQLLAATGASSGAAARSIDVHEDGGEAAAAEAERIADGASGAGTHRVRGLPSSPPGSAKAAAEPGAIRWSPSRKSHPMPRITTGSIPRMDGGAAGRVSVVPGPSSSTSGSSPVSAAPAAGQRRGAGSPAGQNAGAGSSPTPGAGPMLRSVTGPMSLAHGPASATPWGSEYDLGTPSDGGLSLAPPWTPETGSSTVSSSSSSGSSASSASSGSQGSSASSGAPASSSPGGPSAAGPILELDRPPPRARTGVHAAIAAPMTTMRMRPMAPPPRLTTRARTGAIEKPRSGGEAAAIVFIAGLLGLLVVLWWLI
ncbi:MAG TPA: serine/threonine-protein kinase [Kofleriaceae bacterium]|nr:serine/threonine-protein kinase [Kofleriaceae bacterium]